MTDVELGTNLVRRVTDLKVKGEFAITVKSVELGGSEKIFEEAEKTGNTKLCP